MLPEKKIITWSLVIVGALLLWVNRGTLNPIKLPLDADAGAKGDTPNVADPQNATSDNDSVISRALTKLKTGSVKVNQIPQEVKDQLS